LGGVSKKECSSDKSCINCFQLARIINQSACLFAAAVVQLTPEQWLEHNLSCHLFYEQRKDRKNFFELFEQVCAA
jgi:hypothetical protein